MNISTFNKVIIQKMLLNLLLFIKVLTLIILIKILEKTIQLKIWFNIWDSCANYLSGLWQIKNNKFNL